MKKHRIYISVCGEGFGHSSRIIPIADELIENNCEVLIGCYGKVYQYLKNLEKYKVKKIPQELIICTKNGNFETKESFLKTFKNIIKKNKSIIDREKEIIKNFKTTCVVSEGRLSTLFTGSEILNLPTVFVTHQFNLSYETNLNNFLIKGSYYILEKIVSIYANEILITDFLPPDTISYDLIKDVKKIKKKITFVGPIVRKELYSSKPIKKKKTMILTILSGKYGKPVYDCMLEVAKLNKDKTFMVISPFVGKKKSMKNVSLMPFTKNPFPYMKAADVVISRAGFSSIQEIICCGKPGLLIPIGNHIEQETTAKKYEKLNLGLMIKENELTSKQISDKINILLEHKRYRNNAKRFAQKAKKMNSLKTTQKIIKNLSSKTLVNTRNL